MSNIVIFGAAHCGKTTLLGFLSTAMLRHPAFNDEVYRKLKLIQKITSDDEFKIGDIHNPEKVDADLILPSFVSLDLDELRRLKDQNSEGTTKRLHRKQLTICMSEKEESDTGNDNNENMSCTFVDTPGFRQRLTDKYQGFFEGDIGLGVVALKELLDLQAMWESLEFKHMSNSEKLKSSVMDRYRRIFEPIRIWCDYRSPKKLVIVLSKIDEVLQEQSKEEKNAIINEAITFLKECISKFSAYYDEIPIAPISIKVSKEPNNNRGRLMSIFFRRNTQNIYEPVEGLILGNGTLIHCIKQIIEPSGSCDEDRYFSMASVDKLMKTVRENKSEATVLQVRALHGDILKEDTVWIGPVRKRGTKDFTYAKCSISSLKADGIDRSVKPTYDKLVQGNVGGIIFSSVCDVYSAEQYKLSYKDSTSDCQILKSTILYSGELLRGDILRIQIFENEHLTTTGAVDQTYSDMLRNIMPYDALSLLWYGKRVGVRCVGIEYDSDNQSICLSMRINRSSRVSFPEFAFPADKEGKLRHTDNVLLCIPQSIFSPYTVKPNQQELYTYVSAHPYDIINSDDIESVEFEADVDFDFGYIFDIEDLNESSPSIEEDNCEIEDCSVERFIYRIKPEYSAKFFDSLLLEMGREIRLAYPRDYYRDCGSIQMRLNEK